MKYLLSSAALALTLASGGQRGAVGLYEEVKNWPALPSDLQFGEVAGVDVDTHGHVFVFHRPGRGFEPGATELLEKAAVVELDSATGKVIASWGAKTFLVPHGITADDGGNIWLTDVGLQQVFKFSHEGRLLMTLGQPRVGGWDATHFNQPTDIAIRRDGSFYVSDGYVNSRVALFDPGGRFLYEWGKKGSAEAQFSNPHGLAFGPGGEVLVADRENSRIQVFDGKGAFKRQWLGAKEIGRVFSVTAGSNWTATGGPWRPSVSARQAIRSSTRYTTSPSAGTGRSTSPKRAPSAS